MPADHDTRALGQTRIRVVPLGIGTNKWRRRVRRDRPSLGKRRWFSAAYGALRQKRAASLNH